MKVGLNQNDANRATMQLTIAIPVFERKEYFEAALQSAINQEIPVNIIVVDNASSHSFFEDTVNACGYNQIKYFRNAENLGMYGNWNRCAELCETEFVMILGDDDLLVTEYSKVFLEITEKYPELDFFHGGLFRFGDCFNESQQPFKFPVGLHDGKKLIQNAVNVGMTINTNSIAFRASVIKQCKFEYPQYAYNQDWLFVYTAFANSIGYGYNGILLKLRVNNFGNAVLMGGRATLSVALIYHRISLLLSSKKNMLYWKSRIREKFILRNSILKKEFDFINDMINDRNNPFGKHLSYLLEKDMLSRIALKNKLVSNKIIQLFFRIERRLYDAFLFSS
jgi:glycosyltransferase involved in cell wall biosynthesis